MTASVAVLFTFVAALACGKPDGERPAEAAPDREADTRNDPAAGADTIAAPRGIELPETFPADFPLPPGSTVVVAATEADGAGVLGRVTLVVDAPLDDTLRWYGTALEQAGWEIADRDTLDGRIALSAIQGESYAELEFDPGPEPSDGLEIRARIWKTGP
ncbi:MAG: hypothetical protein R3199_10280 [Gemmatimonadota bacterium]|nr:hypothetical protein [Gemmatimonadota bacterium]